MALYDRHASEAVAYFLDPVRMCNTRYVWRLLDILRSGHAGPLLAQLQQSVPALLGLLAFGCPTAAHAAGVATPEPPGRFVARVAACN